MKNHISCLPTVFEKKAICNGFDMLYSTNNPKRVNKKDIPIII